MTEIRTIVEDLLAGIASLPVSETRESYHSFVTRGGRSALRRGGGPEHVTASCFVFSPDLAHVLLSFHRKGQFWVQFGGHIEPGDATVADAAEREGREESGLTRLNLLTRSIVDVDRHDLGGGFACKAHWDVGFVAIADVDSELTVSDESEDVRWFPCEALPGNIPNVFQQRLENVRRLARSL